MILYAVTVSNVRPVQCIVVWERKESADALAEHLNATVQNVIEVRKVESFFPGGMANADDKWRSATESYLRGDHINTSGERE